jgi:hypothetical protein
MYYALIYDALRLKSGNSLIDLTISLSYISNYFFLFIYGAGLEPIPLLLMPFIGLLYQPWMIVEQSVE